MTSKPIQSKPIVNLLESSANSVFISITIILSRILGIVRDQFQAYYFGVGMYATIWELSIFIPALFRKFIGEGGLAKIFITEYTRMLTKSVTASKQLSGALIALSNIALLIFIGIFYILAPYILPLLANQTSEQAELLIKTSRITILFLLFINPFALLNSVSYVKKKFAIPSILESSQNFLLLAVYIAFEALNILDDGLRLLFLSWAFLANGIVQLVGQVYFVVRLGHAPILSFNYRNPRLRHILHLMAPLALGIGVFQINSLLDIIIASYFIPQEVGAIPALRFALRLSMLPLAVVGVALSTTVLPAISREIANKISDGTKELKSASYFSLFLTVPAMLVLIVFGQEIIIFLFERGQWNRHATLETYKAVQYFALSIPIVSVNALLSTYLFAKQNTKLVMKSMILGSGVNLMLNLILVHSMAQAGIALGSSLSKVIIFVFFFYHIFTNKLATEAQQIKTYLNQKLVKAWVLLLVFLLACKYGLYYITNNDNNFGQYFYFMQLLQQPLVHIPLILVGAGIYYLWISHLLKITELDVFRIFFKRFYRKKR